MIRISEDKEDVAEHVEQVLLVELVGDILRRARKVVDDLKGDFRSAAPSRDREFDLLFKPVSAMSRIVCLNAHTTESMTSLN